MIELSKSAFATPITKADRRQLTGPPKAETGHAKEGFGAGARPGEGRRGRRITSMPPRFTVKDAAAEFGRGAGGGLLGRSTIVTTSRRNGNYQRNALKHAYEQAARAGAAESSNPGAFKAGVHAGSGGVRVLRWAPYAALGGAAAVGTKRMTEDRREAKRRVQQRKTPVSKLSEKAILAAAGLGAGAGGYVLGLELGRKSANKYGAGIKPLEGVAHPIRVRRKGQMAGANRLVEQHQKAAAKTSNPNRAEYHLVRAERYQERSDKFARKAGVKKSSTDAFGVNRGAIAKGETKAPDKKTARRAAQAVGYGTGAALSGALTVRQFKGDRDAARHFNRPVGQVGDEKIYRKLTRITQGAKAVRTAGTVATVGGLGALGVQGYRGYKQSVAKADGLPGDNPRAEAARRRRKAGLTVAGVGYLTGSRAKDVAPGAADLLTRSPKKIGVERHAKLVDLRASRMARVSGKTGAVLVAAGLAGAGEGALTDIRERDALRRVREQARAKVQAKVHKSVLEKAFDSEKSRHGRQDIYAGTAAGGAVVAGGTAVALRRKAKAVQQVADIHARNADKQHFTAARRMAGMEKPPGDPMRIPRTAKNVGAAKKAHTEALKSTAAANNFGQRAKVLRRVSRGSLAGAAVLGAAAVGAHDYDRRRGGRSYGY